MRSPIRLAALALLLIATPARAATPADSARIASLSGYVDRLAAFGFSGQIVVAEHGKVVLERACGWADRRFGVPMTPETRLCVGSVTKSFVAAAILKLQSQGRVSTADHIGAHLPGVPADKAGITLAQLLSHTGGIDLDVPDIPDASPRDEVVRAVLAEPLVGPPGAGFRYSNAGFDLLAAIVERVSGTSFDAFVRRALLVPAGMSATGIAGAPDLPPGPAARGYNEWKEVAAWTEYPAGWKGNGSGRMVSTALDLWRWAEALRSGRALTAGEWAEMSANHAVKPNGGYYGFGMHRHEVARGQSVFLIGGDVDGYRADTRIDPAADRVIVVLTNQDRFGSGTERQVVSGLLSAIARGVLQDFPPATIALAAREPAEGAWRLPGGGTIEIWREGGALQLGARGQDAVDLLEPDPRDSTGMRGEVKTASEILMRSAVRGDSALARTVIGPAEYDFAFPFLARRLRALDALHDGLRSVTQLGVISMPWDDEDRLAYLRLTYADGANDVALGWRKRKLEAVTFDEGRPFPVMVPVAPIEGGGYAAYDPIRQRAIPFRVVAPEGGTLRLVLTSPDGPITARRVR